LQAKKKSGSAAAFLFGLQRFSENLCSPGAIVSAFWEIDPEIF
jgi:hypothetical protein